MSEMNVGSETPLVPDTIIGVREFKADHYGRLFGPNQGTIWRPGWNKAMHPGTRQDHRIGSADCTCGFYAYFSDEHTSHRTDETVTGIIEAKGLASVSDKGFRAAEARIIALAPSKNEGWPWFAWLLMLLAPPWSLIAVPLLIANVGLAIRYDDHGWWGMPSLALAIIATVIAAFVGFITVADGDEFWDWRPWRNVTQKQLLERNYPEAQVFKSRRKMLRKIKLSVSPVELVPYGPEAEGFWNG